jgi:hypothetical protein
MPYFDGTQQRYVLGKTHVSLQQDQHSIPSINRPKRDRVSQSHTLYTARLSAVLKMCLITQERHTNCGCSTTRITICYGLIKRYRLFSITQSQDVTEIEAYKCPWKQDATAAVETPCGNKTCPMKRVEWEIGRKDMNQGLRPRNVASNEVLKSSEGMRMGGRLM